MHSRRVTTRQRSYDHTSHQTTTTTSSSAPHRTGQQQQQLSNSSARGISPSSQRAARYGKHDKRDNRHAPPRPFRVVLAVLACIVVAVFLFQMDAFHEHHNHRPLQKNTIPRQYIAPDRVASEQKQQLRRQQRRQEETEVQGSGEQEEEKQELKQQQEQQQQAVVLKQQQQQQQQQNDIEKTVDDQKLRVQKDGSVEIHDQQQNQPPVSVVVDNKKRRRVVFVLRNLKDGQKEGTIVVETVPEWAPLGVSHFWELLNDRFYDQARFFRVLPRFVAQFGINPVPEIQARYQRAAIPDEDNRHGAVRQSNQRGTLSYASSGPNTRTTQLFFNFKDNSYLDKEGFAPIGHIVEGLNLLEAIVDEYREKPVQGKIVRRGNAYLEEEFPRLTYIYTAREVELPDDSSSSNNNAAVREAQVS